MANELDAEVERVARLLCRAHGSDPDGPMAKDLGRAGWGTEPIWNAYRDRAANMVVMSRMIAEQLKSPDIAPLLASIATLAAAFGEASR